MDFLKVSLIILITVVTVNCVPAIGKNTSAVTVIAASVVVMLYIIKTVTPVIENIKSMFADVGMGDLSLIYKSIGISLITQFISDTANDCGNKSLANQMVFAGKIAIVFLALPVYIQVLEMIGRMLK